MSSPYLSRNGLKIACKLVLVTIVFSMLNKVNKRMNVKGCETGLQGSLEIVFSVEDQAILQIWQSFATVE